MSITITETFHLVLKPLSTTFFAVINGLKYAHIILQVTVDIIIWIRFIVILHTYDPRKRKRYSVLALARLSAKWRAHALLTPVGGPKVGTGA
jgi:hypothetical protein